MHAAARSLTALLLCLVVASTAHGRGSSRPAAAPWTDQKTDELLALAREYMGKSRNRDKDALLAKARELGSIPDEEVEKVVKELFKIARSGPRSDGKATCTAKFPKFPGTYHLVGAGRGRKGIFVGLHGGGAGVGDGGSARGQWGGAAGKGLIGVFPTANLPDRDTTWYSTEVEGFVIAILKELKRTYKIDTNRIYCAGHSLGGSGSWHIGLRHADVFAGVSPNAGGLRAVNTGEVVELPGGFIANLFNTPIFFTHYDKDPRVGVADARAAARELSALRDKHPGGYEHVYIEGKGVNHGFPPGGDKKKIINWLTKRKRNPYPEKVVWEPTSPMKRMFFWLRKDIRFKGGGRNARIVATIRKNRVEIVGDSTRGLSVLLADEMFDASKPLQVTLNGKQVHEGRVAHDPATAIESILENIDPNQVFTYRVDVD